MIRPRTISAGGARPARKRAPIFPADRLDRLVVDALSEAGKPLSAYDLQEIVRAERGTSNVAAVYRSLDRLCARGVVQRVASLSGYRLCDAPGAMLAICRGCGTTEPIPVEDIHRHLLGEAAAGGFLADELVVEAVGLCAGCRRD